MKNCGCERTFLADGRTDADCFYISLQQCWRGIINWDGLEYSQTAMGGIGLTSVGMLCWDTGDMGWLAGDRGCTPTMPAAAAAPNAAGGGGCPGNAGLWCEVLTCGWDTVDKKYNSQCLLRYCEWKNTTVSGRESYNGKARLWWEVLVCGWEYCR